MAVTSMIGARIQRREDPKLITGHGNFIDDVKLVNMAHMSIVRSPHATRAFARSTPPRRRRRKGVVAVLTAADFKPRHSRAAPGHQRVCPGQEAGAGSVRDRG